MTAARPPRYNAEGGNDRLVTALERMQKRLDDSSENVAERLDNISNRLERLDVRVAKAEQRDSTQATEMAELRLLIGEARETVEIQAKATRADQSVIIGAAASQGAAQGSAEGAMTALNGVKKYGVGAGVLLFLVSVTELVTNGGKLFEFMMKLFNAAAGSGDPG